MGLTITIVALTIWLFITGMFLLSVLLERNDVIDISWGIGILLSALIAIVVNGARGPLISLLLALVLIWGFRISGRAWFCHLKNKEDPSYQTYQQLWKRWFYLRNYVEVYLLRGILMMLVALPVINASLHGGNMQLDRFAYVGFIFFVTGFLLEFVGEYQLDRFKYDTNDPQRPMFLGLWRFVDRPDLIGEIMIWWGVWVMVWPLPYSDLTVIGPLFVTYLMIKASGKTFPAVYLTRLSKLGQVIPLRLH